MGGPWRDRSYAPAPPPALTPAGHVSLVHVSDSQLGAYLAGIVIGMVLGMIALWIAIPYLPFAGNR